MYLDEIFKSAPHIEIKQLSCDSRMPMQDAIFFCLDGSVYNGHSFYVEAIKNGAKVIVYDTEINTSYNAIFIKVQDATETLKKVAMLFYGDPGSKLLTYVVSGCYGKSVVSYLLNNILRNYNKVGYVTDRGIYDGHDFRTTSYRTLNIIDSMNVTNKMIKENCDAAIYECSVMSLSYMKVDNLHPDYFIYTVSGKEAMEYKELNNNYYRELYAYLSKTGRNTKLIVNSDDYSFEKIIKQLSGVNYLSYGRNDESDYRITSIHLMKDKTTFNIIYKGTKFEVESKLLGLSNVYNLTAAICCAAQRYPLDEVVSFVKDIPPLEGSFFAIDEKQDYQVIVDGACNFETIEIVYDYARRITPENKRIISVLPISYLDNAAKLRELMVLSDESVDLIIVTTGDTYGKDITPVLENAMSHIDKTKHVCIEDREVAIELAIDSANSGDTVLLLGKGEETFLYQNLGRINYRGDKAVAIEAIKKRNDEKFDYELY